MRIILPVALAASLIAGAALAQTPAAPAAPAAAPAAAAPAEAAVTPAVAGKPSAKSGLLSLYNNPAAKVVLKKHIPQVVDFLDTNGVDMIPPEMTLADLVNIPEAGVTADVITNIDKDLSSL